MSQRSEELLRNRKAKLDRLVAAGIDPYPPRFRRTHTTADAIALLERGETDSAASATQVIVAGRIVRMRAMGRATFLDIQDSEGRLQLFLRRDILGDIYSIIPELDLGDFVGATGSVMRTKTGEISVSAINLTVLAKSMRPPPEKFHGLRDQETRYRQRYLDLIATPDVHRVMRSRSRIVTAIRDFLDQRGFLEVETPVLVPVPAGAMAQPFATQHNALDRQLYMRIATELYLKRLIVGGMDKVYEIGRVFRNEGIDKDHNPEFTLLESYEAYADYQDVMEMVEEMVGYVANRVFGTTVVEFDGAGIDLSAPWPRYSLHATVRDATGIDLDDYPDAESLASRMREDKITVTYAESRGRLVDKLVGTFVEPTLIQPSFLVGYPVEMSPFAKPRKDDPRYAERFEAFAAGMEIANSFTELNDPVAQREKLQAQEHLRRQYQGEELDRMDEDFLVALEHGMPPTGGLGIGVDRLVMLLTGQKSIRDVVLFPQVRSME